MRITVDVPDETVMVVVNALYQAMDDMRLVSACVTDPGDGESMTLESLKTEGLVQ